MIESVAVGIDLGTTCSSIAYLRNGKPKIISNNEASYYTPSTVYFDNEGIKTGEDMSDIDVFNHRNFVFSAKRLIGCKFEDAQVQKVCESLGNSYYNIVNNNGRPGIQINFKNKKRIIEPEVISALVLKEMSRLGHEHLSKHIKAVITVPAYFNDAQRQGTLDAARLAGIEVLRIVNEPTAAAIAYAKDSLKEVSEEVNLLVFDMGGGTLDVTILSVKGDNYKVLATGGNTFLGGDDFDNVLVKYFLNEVKKTPGFQLDKDEELFLTARLRKGCKNLKTKLSNKRNDNLILEKRPGQPAFNFTITREQYEDMCGPLFDSAVDTVEEVLQSLKPNEMKIDQVVFAGGSSRTPIIKDRLTKKFPGTIKQDINPEEAVVSGAAYLAAYLNSRLSGDESLFNLIDVTPLTIGFEDVNGYMQPMIKRYSELPVNAEKIVSTCRDGQTKVELPIYQGENHLLSQNCLLQNFIFHGLKPQPKGRARIQVIFRIDENGVLNVRAEDLGTGLNHDITVVPWNQTYSVEENGPNSDLFSFILAD